MFKRKCKKHRKDLIRKSERFKIKLPNSQQNKKLTKGNKKMSLESK